MKTVDDIYKNNGFENRTEYLQNLSCEYEIPLSVVEMFADMLGNNEDFDGLVTALQDYQ